MRMKKILLLLTVSLLFAGKSFSQSFESEIINFGFAFGFQKDKRGRPVDIGALTLGSEIRFNFKDSPISLGGQYNYSAWNRMNPGSRQCIHNYQLFVDYNFKKVHPKILPFAGIGAGRNETEDSGGFMGTTINKSHFSCSPRIGAEFFKRLRLTAEYQYVGNRNSFFNIRVGFVIGS